MHSHTLCLSQTAALPDLSLIHIFRHMVLPGCRKDSIRLLHWIKENLPDNHYLISLLSQFTPFYKSSGYPEINRRITTYEYESVLEEAVRLGLTDGYMQEKSSAKEMCIRDRPDSMSSS